MEQLHQNVSKLQLFAYILYSECESNIFFETKYFFLQYLNIKMYYDNYSAILDKKNFSQRAQRRKDIKEYEAYQKEILKLFAL